MVHAADRRGRCRADRRTRCLQTQLAWSRERGGSELGAGHYPAMVVLHTGLLAVACRADGAAPPVHPALGWPMLAVVLAAQGLRWWCITTLGQQWNTRVVVIPGCAARDRRALPDDSAPQLRGGGRRGNRVAAGALRRGSPRWSSRCATPRFCARGSRSRTPPSRAWRDRPAGRRWRSRGAGHRTVRRAGRAGGRRRRAPTRRAGQGVRRRHDASYPRAPGPARRQRDRADRCAASPTSTATGGSMRRSERALAAACAARYCMPRCGRLPKQPG